jgi:hypothetical protein
MVSVVGNKPEEMSMDDWNMLCGYDFGTIIFPQSLKSLACIISGESFIPCVYIMATFLHPHHHCLVLNLDGDLDGDGE